MKRGDNLTKAKVDFICRGLLQYAQKRQNNLVEWAYTAYFGEHPATRKGEQERLRKIVKALDSLFEDHIANIFRQECEE